MYNKEITSRYIHKYSVAKGLTVEEDYMIIEQAFDLLVNGAFYETFYCTPTHLDELVTGYLAVNGKIKKYSDIESIEINDKQINLYLAPFTETEKTYYDKSTVYYAEDFIDLMAKHLSSSELHKLTGATHIMSIASCNELIVTRQDIGRHNAVDKVYGYCLKNSIDINDKILLSSGRITREICCKAVSMGVKVLVSRSAVTTMAQEIAEKNDITLVGFTRGERFNIYTHPEKIRIKNSR